MSFTTVIVRTVTGSLKLIAWHIKPRQEIKLRERKTADLRDPRFTKEQLEKLRAEAGSTKRPAR
jgi:hypothetical protein